jgi:hypothetical protein
VSTDADVSFVSADADASFMSVDANASFMSIFEESDNGDSVGKEVAPSSIVDPSPDDGALGGDETETEEEVQAMIEEKRVVREIKDQMVSATQLSSKVPGAG